MTIKNSAQNVVPNKCGGWNVKKDNAQRATKHFNTKAEAIGFARKIAQNQRTELVVHKKNGQIQFKDSHGRDPFPPRG